MIGQAPRAGGLIHEVEPIAFTEFTDGVCRPVFEDAAGRQFVVDAYGEPVIDIWFIPGNEFDQVLIIQAGGPL